jgi:5-methylcytosine-specific restriction endonuclease McrA
MTAKHIKISKTDRLAIYLRDGMSCAWCGSSIEDEGIILSLDHVKPQIENGDSTASNMITACRKCNSVRGSRSVRSFAHDSAKYANLDANETMAYIAAHIAMDIEPYRQEAMEILERRREQE